MLKDKLKKYTPACLAVGYAYFGICYLLNLIAGEKLFTNGIFSIPVLAVLVFVLNCWKKDLEHITGKEQKRRRIKFSLITAFLLGISLVMGYQLRMNGMTSLGFKGKFFILLVSGGLSIAFGPVANLFYGLLDRYEGGRWKVSCDDKWIRKSFPISFIVIFLCWIPVFLAYYPAIMSYDFHRQCGEAVRGFIFFNTYQPLAHTFLIWLALQLGKLVGSYEVGMAVLSLFQMLVLDLSMAYCCQMVARLTRKKWPVIVTVCFYALLPIHSVLSVSMTKDILFTAFLTLFLCLFMERRFMKQKNVKGTSLRCILLDLGMVFTGILSILFRNNAIYAILVFIVFAVLWSNRQRVRVLILCLVVVIAGSQVKEGIRLAMHAGSGSKMEMYSVVVAQVARAALNHKDTLSPQQLQMCDYIVPEYVWQYYYPPLADAVKSHVGVTNYLVWKDELPKMFSYWLQIGLAYPNDYIDAFLCLTSGYWFLDDVSHAEMLGVGDDTALGLLYTFNASQNDFFEGINADGLLPGLKKFYNHVVNGNAYYNWPVVSVLFKPATYCWAMFFAMMGLIYVKKYKKLVVCMLPFWYLMTMLLGPTALVRYVYPIMLVTPIMLAWLFSRADWNVDECETKENPE
ncbi:MAG: DUF6020 family protein [Acetatifactor sp.]|nr:DUF6020 family protein [Acetatifactor sp.]